ncbi:MAG: glycosyltransferase family 2 protein [candidate division KSB1 bacterium]|nr:glycosyltransferase family 2 protein [candidate division KSB1 bacterium]
MKLIIQIPCYNEEATLPITLAHLPREIPGVDEVEVLVIDDGSTDRTVEVARAHGVHHIVRLTNNKGLAEAFMAGLDASLRLGADIIVNTDADNQYNGRDIGRLIQPILEGKADMVIGDRQVDRVPHFSPLKKRLQKLGSWVVRQVSNTNVPDATSGFRALSREAAMRMNVVSRFTYTLETIIQAGKKNIALTSVPVSTNDKLRESRLFRSNWNYIKRSVSTIFRIYTMYEPLRTFAMIGGLLFASGVLIGVRFLYFYFTGRGEGHVQSLILAAILTIVGFQVGMIGLLADLIGSNRRLLEDALYRLKRLELNGLVSRTDGEKTRARTSQLSPETQA